MDTCKKLLLKNLYKKGLKKETYLSKMPWGEIINEKGWEIIQEIRIEWRKKAEELINGAKLHEHSYSPLTLAEVILPFLKKNWKNGRVYSCSPSTSTSNMIFKVSGDAIGVPSDPCITFDCFGNLMVVSSINSNAVMRA